MSLIHRTAAQPVIGRATAWRPTRWDADRNERADISTLLFADSVSDSGGRATLWQRVTDWLAGDPWQPASTTDADDARLPVVRRAIMRELGDITSIAGHRLTIRVEAARSLDDLWQARTSLFDVVARARSQHEAQRRLARLDPLFTAAPTRGWRKVARDA